MSNILSMPKDSSEVTWIKNIRIYGLTQTVEEGSCLLNQKFAFSEIF